VSAPRESKGKSQRQDAAATFAKAAAAPAAASGEMRDEIVVSRENWLESAFQDTGMGFVPNDDEILSEVVPAKIKLIGGKDIPDYAALHRKLRKTDLCYKSQASTRKNGVLSKRWRVVANPDDDDETGAELRAEFTRQVLGKIGKIRFGDSEPEADDFAQDMSELLDGIFTGFSVSEVIWADAQMKIAGKTLQAFVPAALRQRRQGRFAFDADGNLKYRKTADHAVAVEPMKFIVFSHNPENENRYGTAESGELFWYVFLKHQFVKFWLVYGEKFGMPTAVATHPPNAPDILKQKILGIAKAIQQQYAVVIPKTVELKLLEAVRTGSANSYESFIAWCDRAIAEALTGQSLATQQSTTGASGYALAKVHDSVRQDYVERDARELGSAINSQLVRWIIDLNFGVDVPAPIFEIVCDEEDLDHELAIDKALHEMGLGLGKTELRRRYGREAPLDEEDTLEGGSAGPVVGFSQGGGIIHRQDAGATFNYPEFPEGSRGQIGRIGRIENSADRSVRATSKSKGGFRGFAKVGREVGREARRRERETDRILERAVRRGVKNYSVLGNLVEAAAERSSDLQGVLFEVNGLMQDRGLTEELASGFAAAKMGGFLLAAAQTKRHADEVIAEEDAREKKRADRSVRTTKRSFQRQDAAATFAAGKKVLVDFEPVEPELAIEWFQGLVPWTTEELEAVAVEAKSAAFTVAGIEQKHVLEKIQSALVESLREGKTLADWKKNYPALLDEYGLTPKSAAHVETIYRTETMRAYGAGRTMALRDPEIKGAFPLWQYVAVMDNRTRPEHAALNGFVADPDDPFWYNHTPPWDYNCRCDVIPITRHQMESGGLEPTSTVSVDGEEQDPRGWPGNKGFRGLGFAA
jgi:SPP1 gp7 family putative phage head morphogenesis protein